MTIKEIVKQYWREFEVLALRAVKNELPQDLIISETLTQAVKDGGYDGELILSTDQGVRINILLEAKLRSNTKADLPLSDFAKSLVISIVRQADMIYIVTNLHFSGETLSTLEEYADRIPLGIQLLNGRSVRDFIVSHGEALDHIHMELQDFLLTKTRVVQSQSISTSVSGKDLWDAFIGSMTHTEPIAEKKSTILVVGNTGCGKSHYIETLHKKSKAQGENVCLIDLSTCLTYKDLFLEIVSKTLGLSIKLLDLIDDESFANAFARIGASQADEDDVQMLKYIFARDTEYPHDYSILFTRLVNFYYNIYRMTRNKNRITVAFLNLVYAQKETLQLLLAFLKHEDAFSSIIEIAHEDFLVGQDREWPSIKQTLMQCRDAQIVTINDWDTPTAVRFLQKHMKGLSKEQLIHLVRLFGTSPAELSSLVELIHYSSLYENTPQELIYQEIMAIRVGKNDSLYMKCLEYLQTANSDIVFIYAFLFFLSGEVDVDFLAGFFCGAVRLEQCLSLLEKSNLFLVDRKKVAIRNIKVEESFQKYCEKALYSFTARHVWEYIENHNKELHLSMEKQMKLTCKINYYRDDVTYTVSLAALGEQYLRLGQLALAESEFKKAYQLEIDNSMLSLPAILRARIYIGLVEALIWKTGALRAEIAEYLDAAELVIQGKDFGLRPEGQLLVLRFYLLAYQFHHMQGNRDDALHYAQKGVAWAEMHNLYAADMEKCGQIWRFYAVAEKEKTQDIEKCLSIFHQGYTRCAGSAKFLFGYVIHQNMIVSAPTPQMRARIKLQNYDVLIKREDALSVDEYLHYRTNMAALHFILHDYEKAWAEYKVLIGKSSIFGIVREEIRILNDMANICWVRGALEDARKKYYMAKRQGMIAGCEGNYWPILINLTSFELFCGNYDEAAKLCRLLYPYLEGISSDLKTVNSNFERQEYCRAALSIHLKNQARLYQKFPGKELRDDIVALWGMSPFNSGESSFEEIQREVGRLDLTNTAFDHNGLYLLKD